MQFSKNGFFHIVWYVRLLPENYYKLVRVAIWLSMETNLLPIPLIPIQVKCFSIWSLLDGVYDCYCELKKNQLTFSVGGQIAVQLSFYRVHSVDFHNHIPKKFFHPSPNSRQFIWLRSSSLLWSWLGCYYCLWKSALYLAFRIALYL